MRRLWGFLVALAAALAIGITPASAVQYGQPDGNGHPWVGLVVLYDTSGSPLWRCTGSLIAPRVFLTAAHCTESPAASAAIWFDEDVTPATHPAYPAPSDADATGTPIPHPAWNGGLGAPNTHDVGIVQLSQPLNSQGFGTLSPANYLDKLATQRGQQDVTFTVVGYGLQLVKPRLSSLRQRMVGTVSLVNLRSALTDGFNIHYSSNPGKGHGGSGGTCFGDSGGPVIHDGKIVGVNSFVLNLNCKGSAFAYRVDIADARSFLDDYVPAP